MNKILLILAALLVSGVAQARSYYQDSARLHDCGGRIELRESAQNLHIQIDNNRRCDEMIVRASRYGRVIKRYTLRTGDSNWTLSNSMWRELQRDGSIYFELNGSWGTSDTINLRIPRYDDRYDRDRYDRDRYDRDRYDRDRYDRDRYDRDRYDRRPGQCGGHTSRGTTGYGYTNSCKCAYYRYGQFQYHAAEYNCSSRRRY